MKCEEHPVILIISGKKVKYKLNEDILINDIRIPSGFITDGCSSLKWMWPVFPPIQDYFRATTLHDYLIANGVGWRQAEVAFKEALIECGVGGVRVFLMVNAVRVFGVFSRRRKL